MKTRNKLLTFTVLLGMALFGNSCESDISTPYVQRTRKLGLIKDTVEHYRTSDGKPVMFGKKIEALTCEGKPFATHVSSNSPSIIDGSFIDHRSGEPLSYRDTPLRISDTVVAVDGPNLSEFPKW